MNRIKSKKLYGFTMIELSAVCILLLLLTYSSMSNTKKPLETGKITQAEADVAALCLAATDYLADIGDVPRNLNDLKSTKNTPYGQKGPWVRNDITTDPWNSTFVYNASLRKISSNGPDKVTGTADDITMKF